MKRSLFFAVLIQGAGAVLAIVTVLGISRYFGPVQQGGFALYKNWYDFTSSALLFGLPQGIIYTVNKHYISPSFALRLALVHSGLTFVPVLIISCLQAQFRYLPPAQIPLAALAMTFGICGYMFHGIARNVVLTINDGLNFSLLAVVPTVGIVPLCLLSALFGCFDVGSVFAANGLICGLSAWLVLATGDLGPALTKTGWRVILAKQSGHFFLQSLLFAMQPFAAYYLLEGDVGGVHNVGIFSFALVALIAVNSLIAMVAPVLVNRWSKLSDTHAERQLSGVLLKLALVAGIPLSCVLWLLAPAATLVVGDKFLDAVPLIRVLAIAVVPLVFTRFAQPALMALGKANIGTMMGFGRVVAMLATAIGLGVITSPLLAMSWAWSVAEFVAAIVLLVILYSSSSSRRDLKTITMQ